MLATVDAVDAIVKGLLYAGVTLLLGAGVFARLVAPDLARGPARPALRAAAWLGGAIVLASSAWNLAAALRGALGFVDASLLREYATSSLHGRATLVRSGLVLLLPAALRAPRGAPGDALFAVLALAVLGTLSAVGHNAAMGGWAPPVADLAHLAAAVAWLGAVWGVAFAPGAWSAGTALARAMERTSAVGLAAVATLFATGAYSASLHVGEARSLATTAYGGSLVAKVALVLVVVGIAAANRWRFLPALRRGEAGPGFRRALRVEAVLLALVLGLTGLLTTRPVPH